MDSEEFNGYIFRLDIEAADSFRRVSYPVRYGKYSAVETDRHIYHFNLNGELKIIQSKEGLWPRDEWLKRTPGNNWIYYTPGIYTGIMSYIGEYYLPCFNYGSNSIFAYRPFEKKITIEAVNSFDEFIDSLRKTLCSKMPLRLKEFIQSVVKNDSEQLRKRAVILEKILGRRINVLPPDSRHVDYGVIPLIIADGCLYNCGFCMVKSGDNISVRPLESIVEQIDRLRLFFKDDIINYNSLFLGEHDALYAGEDLLLNIIDLSYSKFGIKDSYMKGCNLFMFGSVHSLLGAKDRLFQHLNRTGFYTYINIGLESADDATLAYLNKPVKASDVVLSFKRIMEINRRFENIEISSNFLLGHDLSEGHYESIVRLCNENSPRRFSKATIYFSPLVGMDRGDTDLQNKFKILKNRINLPTYIYIIQKM